MARSCFSFPYSSFDKAKQIIETTLRNNGYNSIEENGERVWKNGVGFLTAMKYIKVEFAENQTVNVYGWVRAIASSEQNLEGFVAAIPKKQVLGVIQNIGKAIE